MQPYYSVTAQDFYKLYGSIRAILLAGAILVVLAGSVANAYVFDVEIPTPERDIMEKQARDKDNERAYERRGTDRERSGDRDKSRDYERDHGV